MTLARAIEKRGIRRLCHFTPSRNLAHIVIGKKGILATARLERTERDVFNPSDLQRLDGHKDHICCSVEYPNAYFFRRARENEILFKDWVVLLLDPTLMLVDGVKFCSRNASAERGRLIKEGMAGFESMYAPTVVGAYNKKFVRFQKQSPAVTTDNQAEVLIPDQIPLERIVAVAVRTKDQAVLEIERLRLLGLTQLPRFLVAPLFYDPDALMPALYNGNVPPETPHDDAT